MAEIDKTYIDTWEVFDKIRNWALDQHFMLKNGQEIHLKDYLYHPELTKEEWDYNESEYKKEHPDWTFDVVLWNTPTYVDIWLIRNCPFEEIQDRLKEQYGGGWSKTAFTDHNENSLYEQIQNHTSVYDTYKRNGLGKKANVKFYNIYGDWIRDKKCSYFIEVNPYWLGNKRTTFDTCDTYWYNEDVNAWYNNKEAMPWTSSCYRKRGNFTKKNLVNLIKKWDLPKGTIVKFECSYNRYIAHDFYATVN